uniref:Probable deoxycytidylate deaminase n=1 Tax=Romanomermis culicivorax TaxID=13658 RepID=A0A915KC58_ROMCU
MAENSLPHDRNNFSSSNVIKISEKRCDYINWQDYFMSIACLSARRSKDPRTQVGACIVNEENKIVGIGYNGMPIGCCDDLLPWGRESNNPLENKYVYVCHAEMNAIMNSNSLSLKNCRIYATHFPCNECTKLIIQSGIRKIIYMNDNNGFPTYHASKKLLNMVGIDYQ